MTRSAQDPVTTAVEMLCPRFEAPPDLRARLVRLAAETATSEVKRTMEIWRPRFEAPPDLRARLVRLAAETAVSADKGRVIKIVLVDRHKILRDGLRALLEKHPGMEVVGEAADGHQAIAVSKKAQPDVVVMDVSMPEFNGIDAVQRIVSEQPQTKIIALAMSNDHRHIGAVLSAGASGYLLRSDAGDELVQAIEATIAGRTYLSQEIAGGVADTPRKRTAPHEPLHAASGTGGARVSKSTRR